MTYIICSFLNGENYSRIVFQHTRPTERPDPRRSRPAETPLAQISPGEEAEIIRRQAEIVGADANANLEQVILHEKESEVQAEQILENPEQLRSFLHNQVRTPGVVEGAQEREALFKLLNNVKYDTAFSERLFTTAYLTPENFDYSDDICLYVVENMDHDERFYAHVFEGVSDERLIVASLRKIHNQAYLKTIVEKYRKGPRGIALESNALLALQNITDQIYLAEISTDKYFTVAIREVAISKLTDIRLIQTFINANHPGLMADVETEEALREAEVNMLRSAALRRLNELEERNRSTH